MHLPRQRVGLQATLDHVGPGKEIEHALPVKWSSSDLDANTSQVVMESLELAHHGLRKAS